MVKEKSEKKSCRQPSEELRSNSKPQTTERQSIPTDNSKYVNFYLFLPPVTTKRLLFRLHKKLLYCIVNKDDVHAITNHKNLKMKSFSLISIIILVLF